MLVLGLFAIFAAAVGVVQVTYSRRLAQFLNSERPAVHYSPVQIICGDCAGDAIIPERTFMDRFGRCERCGGSSYMLASERAFHLRETSWETPLRIAS